MIELIFAPMDWFTHFEPIILGRTIEAGVDALGDAGVKGGLWDRELTLVLATCRVLGKSTEGAFALLKTAEAVARKGSLDRARDLVEEAGGCLAFRNDQKAILEWIQGSLEWQIKKQTSGYKHWKNARTIYDELIKSSIKEHRIDRVDWYKDCQGKLDGYKTDLAFSIAGGYLLLNHFNKSRLGPISDNLIQAIRQELSSKSPARRGPDDLERLRLKLSMLEKATLFTEEEPETRLVCAQFCIELGQPRDIDKGLAYLRLAEAKYHSDADNLVVVYWILGAVQWTVNGMSREPVETWRLCLDQVKALEERANRSKDKPRVEWYQMLEELLDLGVETRLSQNHGPRPVHRTPARAPAPEPVPAGEGAAANRTAAAEPSLDDTPVTDEEAVYRDLLQITGRDIEQAERLIEFERRKAPTKRRLDWIMAAITRWRDDNR